MGNFGERQWGISVSAVSDNVVGSAAETWCDCITGQRYSIPLGWLTFKSQHRISKLAKYQEFAADNFETSMTSCWTAQFWVADFKVGWR